MRFGLLGKVLSYSLSPTIHQAVYDAMSISATYDLIEVPVDEMSETKIQRNYVRI